MSAISEVSLREWTGWALHSRFRTWAELKSSSLGLMSEWLRNGNGDNSHHRPACFVSYHSVRYSRFRKSFAAAAFVTRMFAPSYWIFFPACSATTPSSIVSVSRAAYSKGQDA